MKKIILLLLAMPCYLTASDYQSSLAAVRNANAIIDTLLQHKDLVLEQEDLKEASERELEILQKKLDRLVQRQRLLISDSKDEPIPVQEEIKLVRLKKTLMLNLCDEFETKNHYAHMFFVDTGVRDDKIYFELQELGPVVRVIQIQLLNEHHIILNPQHKLKDPDIVAINTTYQSILPTPVLQDILTATEEEKAKLESSLKVIRQELMERVV